ncbi:MAG: hypothetical protein KDI09_03200 [Halioglobus sp.]|nr:hypothetical protein [Halioglobus sp.]
MNILETEWWSMALPPEWWADTDEDSILVGDRDGVGTIEISTLHKSEGEFEREDVLAIAREESGQHVDWTGVRLGDFAGVTADGEEEDAALREWFVACGSLLLYITYSCDVENRGMDDAAVNELLDTLLAAEEAPVAKDH